jgi:hypothetical protein
VTRPVKSGDEQDVFTRWRRAYCWTQRAGACKRVKRQANRRERRQVGRLVDAELAPDDREWMASLGPLYDMSDCQHGCNGWPCGSERCTFVCHEGLPVKT